MSFGLVLAGGGLTGLAWEVGVISALHEQGIDLTTADAVVGTSAGSIVGSMLMSGIDYSELVSYVTDPDQTPLRLGGQPMTDGDPVQNLMVLGRWSGVPTMDADTAAEIAQISARGKTLTEEAWIGLFAEIVGPLEWSPKLGIVSIDIESGEPKLWSAADGAELLRAVASSCAVPGMFPAVEINGGHYVDGGLWSPTSAQLLLDKGLSDKGVDSVVIISPLGGDDWIGQFCDRATQREMELLASAGIKTELLVPTPPIAPLSAFNEADRIPQFERGRIDGLAASDRVRAAIA